MSSYGGEKIVEVLKSPAMATTRRATVVIYAVFAIGLVAFIITASPPV